MSIRTSVIIAGIALLCAGCSTLRATEARPLTGLSPTNVATQSVQPDIGITLVAPTAQVSRPCTAPNRVATETTTRAIVYDASVTVELPKHTLTAVLETHYQNVTGSALREITFYVPLGQTKNAFFLASLSAEPIAQLYTQAGDRLDVVLAEPLAPGCSVRVTMAFRVNVPLIGEGSVGGFGYFGYTDRQMNLGDWLPTVAPYRNGAWVIPRAALIGETRITESAAYRVAVAINGASSPQRLEVAGPGTVTRADANHWTFDLDSGRNFALSISESFIKQSTTTTDGVTVDLYRFATGKPTNAPQQALDTARDAATVFARDFETTPFQRLAVVEGDFPDGMEFSGIVFVSTRWFTTFWEGKPDSWLTVITAHEVAHQWWYSSVGDDQGQTPWLDEAFAIYSELLYIEDTYPKLVDWWWKWRIEQYKPTGFVDSSVYDFAQVRLYINAVYLRGAEMLHGIRDAIGSPAFIRWLRAYAKQEQGRIVAPETVWRLLESDDYAKIAAIRAKYLKVVDPLGLDTPVVIPATVTR